MNQLIETAGYRGEIGLLSFDGNDYWVPDVADVKHPGFSHRSGSRIDQLYFKGKGLKNNFTEVISSWHTGFPSDHFLIVSKFKLNF